MKNKRIQPQASSHKDEFDDIRSEYKTVKHKIDQYDRFIDKNQGLITFLLVILIITSLVASTTISSHLLLYTTLALVLFTLLFAIISGWRKATKKDLEVQIDKLRHEATVLRQLNTPTTQHISRDEIDLYAKTGAAYDNNDHKSHTGVIVFIIIASIITVSLICQAGVNHRAELEAERERQAETERQTQEERNSQTEQNYTTQSAPTHCISTGSGSAVFTNCY